MSDTNRIGLSYVPEVTFGTTPSAALQRMRITGESLRQETQSVSSNEIDPTRQIAELIRTGVNAAGGVNFELSYAAHDTLIAAAVSSAAWSSPVTVGPISTIDFGAAVGNSQTINDSGNGFAGILQHGWVKIEGSAATNNGIFKVLTSSAGTITVQNPNGTLDAIGDSITITLGAQVVNGVALATHSIEREYQDLTNTYVAYTGMAIDQFSLTVAIQQIMTGTMEMIGIKEESKTATIGNGSYTAAPTNKVMQSVDHVTGILEGGTAVGVQSVSMQLNNNLRQRLEVGTLGPQSIGQGQFAASGTLVAYFTAARSALADKYLNWTDTSLAQILQDTAGNAYVIDHPLVKLSAGPRNTPGANSDIVLSLNWAASKHPTEGITTRIVRFAA